LLVYARDTHAILWFLLPQETEPIEPLTTLPMHHKDPLDWLLAATVLVEGLTFVWADAVFDAYGLTRLW
jgi:PIN domain nuclease of toxin-antitoxin system